MKTYIIFNGEYFPADTPLLKTDNRAFLYADGFFETIRCYGSTPLLFDYHWQRIVKTTKTLHFELSTEYTFDYFRLKIESLLKKNKQFKGARVRITFFREGSGLYTPTSDNMGYLIESFILEDEKYPLNKKGLFIDIYPDNMKQLNSWSNLKILAATLYTQAGIYKKQHSLHDCIILNENGFLCEAVSSNLFVIVHDTLYTPPLKDGCVAGIMREKILDLANNTGIKTNDNFSLKINQLLNADEIFLTNAIQGIQWVGAFRNKRYFHSIASKLHHILNDWVYMEWGNN